MAPISKLFDIRIRDPFIIEPAPGRFVLFGTTDANVWGGPATGFDCYISNDLENWDGPHEAFRPPEGFWSSTQFWAPEVHAHGGQFYLIATFLDGKSGVRGVATLISDEATGPFRPWSDGPVTPPGVPCLDGTLLIDDTAQPWLVYSRGAEGTADGEPALADGEMYAVQLSIDLTRAAGAPQLLFRASSAPWSRPLHLPEGVEPPPGLRLAKHPLFTDGPFLTRGPGGALLMLWSSFGDEGYAIGVATSQTGSILGPWAQTSTPLWARNGGHGMILTTTQGTQYLVFHAPNDTPHERTQLVRIAYRNGSYQLDQLDRPSTSSTLSSPIPRGSEVTDTDEPFDPDTRLGAILDVPKGRDIIASAFPGLEHSPAFAALAGLPIHEIADRNPDLRDPEQGAAFWGALAAVERVPALRDLIPARGPSTSYEPENSQRATARISAPSSARLFEMVEVTIDGPSHGNPFVDVELVADLVGPNGSRVVGGFYDGDGRYLIRFLPDAPGRWLLVTRASIPSLDGLDVSVTVSADAAGHGPVLVDDTFHFAHADSTRFSPFGTTAYAWTHQPEQLRSRTLATLANAPFNKIRMCVFPKSYLYNTQEPELQPFVRDETGDWDLETFNPGFFRHLEDGVRALDNLGIQADLILLHPYDRWGFATMGRAADDRYVTYVTRRLSAFPNVWWSLANEYDLLWSKTDSDWERLAGIVRANDPVRHLLSIHNGLRIWDNTRSWVTHASLQGVDLYRTTENVTEWRTAWQKPVVVDEPGYEGNLDQGWGNLTAEEIVRRAWEGVIRGGYFTHGETYFRGDEVIWWAKGGELHGDSPARLAFLRRIVAEIPGGRVHPLTSDWDAPRGGTAEHSLTYYGSHRPAFRTVAIPAGRTAALDVIDTWNMTVEALEGSFTGMSRVTLPARPYLALRIRLS